MRKMIAIILISILILTIISFNVNAAFSPYDTLSFHGKADTKGLFDAYTTLTFGGKGYIQGNERVVFYSPNPTNGSTDISTARASWNITIEDLEGDQFDWSIDTVPNVGNNSLTNSNNGSKSVTLSGLQSNTTYTIYVNVTDDGSSETNKSINTFTTETEFTSYTTLTFGGKSDITAGIDIDIQPDDWNAGTINCNEMVTYNFTLYQNASSTISVQIAINTTNYTYVNYTTWSNNGHNQFCANFTNNTWNTESMIQPKVAGAPVTYLNHTVPGTTSFSFGVRIWMPKTVKYAKREDFEIYVKATEK